MARRNQITDDVPSDVKFRVVEIYVVSKKSDGTAKHGNRFLLVDNRRETLELVQKDMHDFVKNAVLAKKIGEMDYAASQGKL